jgi:catechol 2,3-dioxygenase-like lactoylglutathione lyase family enzyme
MHRVITFLIAKDSDAALRFYRDSLGLKFIRDDGFALIFDMDGVMLRISSLPDFMPAQHTVLGWRSKDIAAEVDSLTAKGIVLNRYPSMGQDERGVCTFPNGDKVAWFCDPSGNVLSISQHGQE